MSSPTLPSVVAAESLIKGNPGGMAAVVMSTLGRAAIISLGLWAAGDRNPRRVAKNALFGALAIEVFVLGNVARQMRQRADLPPTPPVTL
jgi:hypothetical protein